MKASLSLENIKRQDKSGMLGLLLDFPLQCRSAVNIANACSCEFLKRDFKKIVFIGVGGSAAGADLVRGLLYSQSKIPIIVVREYELPAFVDDSCLIFACSYSGNTQETLNAYRQARQKTKSLICISCAGKLKEEALAEGALFIELPKGLPARCALGYLSIVPLVILWRLGIIEDVGKEINQAAQVLEDLRGNSLNPHIGRTDNIAKQIALELFNKIAIVYSCSSHFDVAAMRLKSELCENAKSLAYAYTFPEAGHNEIMGWQNPAKLFKNLTVLMLKDKGMDSRLLKSMEITKGIIQGEGASVFDIWSRGEGLLSRIFSLIYIGDFISFYLAILYGVDPTPVDKISYLKKKLIEE